MAMQRKFSKAAIERLEEIGRDLSVLHARATSWEFFASLPPMEGYRNRMREPLDDWRAELVEIQERYLKQAESQTEQAQIALVCEHMELTLELEELDDDFQSMHGYIAELGQRPVHPDMIMNAVILTLRRAAEVGDEDTKWKMLRYAKNMESYYRSLMKMLSDVRDEFDPTRKKRKK